MISLTNERTSEIEREKRQGKKANDFLLFRTECYFRSTTITSQIVHYSLTFSFLMECVCMFFFYLKLCHYHFPQDKHEQMCQEINQRFTSYCCTKEEQHDERFPEKKETFLPSHLSTQSSIITLTFECIYESLEES